MTMIVVSTRVYVDRRNQKYGPSSQARQTRSNSGGVAEGIQDSTKGGVAIFFYFLRVKNRTF